MNAIFVASEFAIVTSRRPRIHKLADEGNRRARIVSVALDAQREFIATTQLGITMAGLALGWIGEPFLAGLIAPLFEQLFSVAADSLAVHAVALVLAFALITALMIVLGELAPKGVALWHPEPTALVVIPPVYFFGLVFRPFVLLLNATSTAVLRLFGLHAPPGQHVVTSEDLAMMARESVEAGAIGEEEARILQRTFRFAGRQAHDVMVPRTDIVALAKDTTVAEAAQSFIDSGFTRLPVFQGSLDNIIGVVSSKDVLSRLVSADSARPLGDMVRPIKHVPESKDLAELLDEMRLERTHMAIVVDEYGVTAGMVTMEDLVEEIVGEITSEHRKEEQPVEWIDKRTVIVDAAISLDDLNEQLGVVLGDEDVNTLGGYVFRELGRVPKVGESFDREGIEFTVLTMIRNRVGDVRIRRAEGWRRPSDRQKNGATADHP